MNAAKHTPGPWVASCRSISYAGGEWSEDEFLQWEVDGPRTPYGRGNYFQADALLIAAAPELLEALEGLLCWCQGYEADKLNPHAFSHMESARAAIAKATGSAQ